MLNPAVTGLLIFLVMIVAIIAQVRVSSAFKRYSQSGRELVAPARKWRRRSSRMQESPMSRSCRVNHSLAITMTDKENSCACRPACTTMSPSRGRHRGARVWDAIQHKQAYAPLQIRMAVVPVTMVASQMLHSSSSADSCSGYSEPSHGCSTSA